MKKEGKAKFVQDFASSYKESEAAFIVKVAGLTVPQLQALRTQLRNSGARLQIGKVRLMKLALNKLVEGDQFVNSLGWQIGTVFSKGDSTAVAKNLVDFAKEIEQADIVSGIYKNKFMNAEDVKSFASIPPYTVLVSMLAGGLNNVIAGLARSLDAVVQKKSS